jgi:hypothetical protein
MSDNPRFMTSSTMRQIDAALQKEINPCLSHGAKQGTQLEIVTASDIGAEIDLPNKAFYL